MFTNVNKTRIKVYFFVTDNKYIAIKEAKWAIILKKVLAVLILLI